uniref:Uncharacterized protein n=1 Tax=Arundo donax TaxID=35708 RepID=A0A0A9BK64_ARUDO
MWATFCCPKSSSAADITLSSFISTLEEAPFSSTGTSLLYA